jgi:hypothetical protein
MINLFDTFIYLLNQQLIKNACSSARKFLFFWGGQFEPARGGFYASFSISTYEVR